MRERQHEHYIGDGAYCALQDGMIVIWTSDGLTEKNHLYMSGYELESFCRWLGKTINPEAAEELSRVLKPMTVKP